MRDKEFNVQRHWLFSSIKHAFVLHRFFFSFITEEIAKGFDVTSPDTSRISEHITMHLEKLDGKKSHVAKRNFLSISFEKDKTCVATWVLEGKSGIDTIVKKIEPASRKEVKKK